jgi:hypothetical protein
MALVIADRVRETTTTTGTGAVTLAGAVTGCQAFSSAIGDGNTTYYTIADQGGPNWEVGLGTYTSAGNTLARTTVYSSSNSGSLVSFTAGAKDVFVTLPSQVTVPIASPTFTGTTTIATVSAMTLGGDLTGGDYLLTRTMYKDTGWVYYNSSTTAALNFTNGSQQRWAPTASSSPTLTISNWPPSGNLGELLIEGVNLGAAGTITWPTINWITSTGATTTTFASNGVTLQTSGTDWCLLWTRDAGTTIYGKFVR